jgi:hypothetical protein
MARQMNGRPPLSGSVGTRERRLLAALLFLLALAVARPGHAEFPETQARSAHVLNLIRFVEWPDHAFRPEDGIRLCVIGDDRLQAALAESDGRKVGEYSVQVMSRAGGGALGACHVLYIGERERRRLTPIIRSLGNAPVLTVSDAPGFAERGGGIGLLYRGDRMLFEVNLASTRRAGLRLSGQMLNLSANIFGK